jgi:hypothetical protein
MLFSRYYNIPNIYLPKKLIDGPINNNNISILNSNKNQNMISIDDLNQLKSEMINVKQKIICDINDSKDEIKNIYLNIDKKMSEIQDLHRLMMQEITHRNTTLYYNELIITCVLIVIVILLIFR